MYRVILLFVVVSIITRTSSAQISLPGMPKEISETMQIQQNAWNSGDLDAFMKGYWESEDLLFIGSSVTTGYQATLSNYKESYQSKEAMGILEFTNLTWLSICTDSGLLIGEWNLIGINNGMYSLLWKQMDGEWVIIADHSSD